MDGVVKVQVSPANIVKVQVVRAIPSNLLEKLSPETASVEVAKAVTARLAAEAAQGLSEDARDASITAQGLAEAAQTGAETAQGLSESARDASIAAQGLAETAQGLAETAAETAVLNANCLFYATKALLDADLAHAAGTRARVTNDSTAANNVYYTKSGASGTGSWVADAALYIPDNTVTTAKIADTAVTPAKASFFDVVNGPNLYNPALATDGYIALYLTGVYSAYANGAQTGKMPVSAGKTYTLSMPNTEKGPTDILSCYNSSGAFLGNDHAISSNPVASGITNVLGTRRNENGRWQLTFTIAEGSSIAYVDNQFIAGYQVHNTSDFNRMRNSIQLEEGSAFTVFKEYGYKDYYLKSVNAPSQLAGALTDIATLESSFNGAIEITPSRNIYNPALAINGYITNYSNGINAACADAIISGNIPVEAGKTYTISMPSTENGFNDSMQCFNASLSYIGNTKAISTYPVASGITMGAQVSVNGRKQVTFSIDSESLVRYVCIQLLQPYAAHTTGDFDRIRNSVQLEEGSTSTAFQTYGVSYYSLKGQSVPADYSTLVEDVATLQTTVLGLTPTGVTVIKSGDDVFIRTAWDATYDLVERLVIDNLNANRCVEFYSLGLIPKGTDDSLVAGTTPTSLKNCEDDIAPANYNGTYIGANHGASQIYEITATSHGKTVVDVGSEWVDSASRKFYILKIVDTNKLWIISENLSATDVWSFGAVTGATLTHSANATHTGTITIGSSVLSQLIPAVKNHTRKLYLNGKTEITTDGVYKGEFFEVINSYDISDVPSLLDYVVSQVGSATQPSFTDSSIAVSSRVSISYKFHANGSCTVYQSFMPKKTVNMGYLGFIQGMAITPPSGGTLHEYVPQVSPFSIGGNSYDLAAVQDITSLSDSLELTAARWADANNPPSRFVQFAKTSGGAKSNNFGFTLGYCTDVGIGVPATRKDLAASAGFIYTSKKQYPKLITGGSTDYPDSLIPANTLIDAVCFRCPINYNYDTDATNISWYYVGDTIYLMLDYHTNVNKMVALPTEMSGRAVTVLEKSANMTIGSSFVSPDGIHIAVTGGYGAAVLRLN